MSIQATLLKFSAQTAISGASSLGLQREIALSLLLLALPAQK
jgi:hypothetical protein